MQRLPMRHTRQLSRYRETRRRLVHLTLRVWVGHKQKLRHHNHRHRQLDSIKQLRYLRRHLYNRYHRHQLPLHQNR